MAPPAGTCVSALCWYPVKSMAGASLRSVRLDARGIVMDRNWMVVSERRGRFLTQRGQPRLALLRPDLADDTLTITAPDGQAVTVEPAAQGALTTVQIWHQEVAAVDEGDHVADWLSRFLGKRSRLVRLADGFVRPLDPDYSVGVGQVGLADGFPLLLMNQSSLDDLNGRLVAGGFQAVRMNRFRPNVVIDGAPAYAEDTWATVRIGEVILDLPKPCGRCQITNTDQETGVRTREVLRTLDEFRRQPQFDAPLFGWNAVHRAEGRLETGARLEVLSYR